jgi:chorismate-pyruvate lyase
MNSPTIRAPDLRGLFALFRPDTLDEMPEFEMVPGDEVPEPYHRLLVHEHHMTVTVEDFHGDAVDVRILARAKRGDFYARKILLALQRSGRVVQFGIMRINLTLCGSAVREEIIAGQTPLGRILIEHDVLRRIEPKSFLRIVPGNAMMKWFGLVRPRPTYGRLALIHCDGQPAVELLEIVAPEPPDRQAPQTERRRARE